MCSAIPVALLCMILNCSEGSRAAAQKGTKSCWTQGDFHLSDHPSICPERADLRPERADFRPELADSRPERADFWPEGRFQA